MPLRVSPVSRRAFIVMRVEGSYPLPNCSHWSSELLGWPNKTVHTFIHSWRIPYKIPTSHCEAAKTLPMWSSWNDVSKWVKCEMSGTPRIFTNKVQRSFLKTFFSWICVSRTKAILIATTMICSNAPSDLSLQFPIHRDIHSKYVGICMMITKNHSCDESMTILWYHCDDFSGQVLFFLSICINLSAIQHHSTPFNPFCCLRFRAGNPNSLLQQRRQRLPRSTGGFTRRRIELAQGCSATGRYATGIFHGSFPRITPRMELGISTITVLHHFWTSHNFCIFQSLTPPKIVEYMWKCLMKGYKRSTSAHSKKLQRYSMSADQNCKLGKQFQLV